MESPSSTTRIVFSKTLGSRVLVREWGGSAAESPKKCVLLLHGLGDHSGRHGEVAGLLVRAGYRVVGIDWPGCGGSDGIRGDLPLPSASGELLEEILETHDLSPEGVFAHSAGGFLSLQWLGRRSRDFPRLAGLRWLWLSSPLVRPSHRQPRWKIAIAKALARRLPEWTLSTGVKARDCHHTSVLEFAEAERSRDGVHHRVSLRFATGLLGAETSLLSRVADIRPGLALLLTQGAEDGVCPPGYASLIFERFPSREKTWLFVAGARHEPVREPEALGLRPAIRAWIETRTESAGGPGASVQGTD